MKKQVKLFTAAILTLSSLGFSATPQKKEKVTVMPDKILIAYYSWSGNTKAAAEQIQRVTGGTLFRIKPHKPYPVDYQDCVDQARKEVKSDFKPKLAAEIKDFKEYDVIFIGSPNWCGTMAPPVASFLTQYNLEGKTVIPFFTHGGGGMQKCEKDIYKLCKKSTVMKAMTFYGSRVKQSGDEITKWVKSCVNLERK